MVVTTADGSHTVIDPHLHVHYHSIHGAITESRQVFVGAGLKYIADRKSEINILEIGFGTGLNALLTFLFQKDHPAYTISYTGIEKFPLGPDTASALNYPHQLDAEDHRETFLRMHRGEAFQEGNFHFVLNVSDITKEIALPECDLIYFDAFAPEAQPEMWQTSVLTRLHNCLNSGGALVTYCAKGQFKRDLRATGFVVETLPGPPGKREMVRALKP